MTISVNKAAPEAKAKVANSEPKNPTRGQLKWKSALKCFGVFLLPLLIGSVILFIIGPPAPPPNPGPVRDYSTAVYYWDVANKSMTHVTKNARNCFHPHTSDFEDTLPRLLVTTAALKREHKICLGSGAKKAEQLMEAWRRTPNYSPTCVPLLRNISAIAESCAWASNMAWHLLVEAELAFLDRYYVEVGELEETWNQVWRVTRWRPRFGGRLCEKCRDVPVFLDRKMTLMWLRGQADFGRDGHEAWRDWLMATLDGLKAAIDAFVQRWDSVGFDEGRESIDKFMRKWLGQM